MATPRRSPARRVVGLAAVLPGVLGLVLAPRGVPTTTTRLHHRRPRLGLAAAAAVETPAAQPPRRGTSWVTRIESDDAFLAAMRESSDDRLVVVKFFASWCRACKTIEPRFRRLAAEFHDDAAFFEIEFGTQKELCRRLGIKKLPCVQFYRGADGLLDTVLCGPSKFPDVRVKMQDLLGDHVAVDDDVPEFTDISTHYNATDVVGGAPVAVSGVPENV